MFPKATYDIVADRYTPFEDYVDIVGFDFTGAVFDMEIRDRANGGSVRATVVPTVSVTTTGGISTSRVTFAVSETDMEAMPTDGVDAARDVNLYYDVHITPSGENKFVAFGGMFKVRAGVTQ